MQPVVVNNVLYGAHSQALALVQRLLPACGDFGNCRAFGFVKDGELVGGIVWNNWHPGVDIEATLAITTAAWFRPRAVAEVFRFPFEHLALPRISSRVAKRHKGARELNERLGFRLEGVKRHGFDGRQDLMLYGLLRRECRFLKGS